MMPTFTASQGFLGTIHARHEHCAGLRNVFDCRSSCRRRREAAGPEGTAVIEAPHGLDIRVFGEQLLHDLLGAAGLVAHVVLVGQHFKPHGFKRPSPCCPQRKVLRNRLTTDDEDLPPRIDGREPFGRVFLSKRAGVLLLQKWRLRNRRGCSQSPPGCRLPGPSPQPLLHPGPGVQLVMPSTFCWMKVSMSATCLAG